MNFGISYTGSKRKLAPNILNVITARHKGITDFYDLFGGGGAVSFAALHNYRFNVHYNELNSHIYELVKYLQANRTLEPKFYEWVTRGEFFKQCNRTDADWYSGFVMACWSFGNNQADYMYGGNVEETKRLAHQFVVHGCLESMRKLNIDIPELKNIKDVQKRRMFFCSHIEALIGNRFDIQHLEQIQHLESIQHLERIQHFERIQHLHITNLSYENVVVNGDNPIIYCDIPYKGTAEYKEGNFNHEKFYNWANEVAYPVYISEYNTPFEVVERFGHRSTLSATNNAKKTIESLFWNGKGDCFKSKLF